MKTVAIDCNQQNFRIIIDGSLIDHEERWAESFLLLQEIQEVDFTFALGKFLK